MDALLPRPRQLRRLGGALDLSRGIRLVSDGHDPALEALLPWRRAADGVVVRLVRDELLDDEAHRLVVDDEVVATAGGEAGLVWALQTLRQLAGLPAVGGSGPAELPRCSIEDAPEVAWRGVMVDVARHFMPLGDLHRLLELMSAHKLNRLHLHLTDNQGWRFESLRWPQLVEAGSWRAQTRFPGEAVGDQTPHGGFYTQTQLRELVARARSLGIVVVPEVDMPGHLAAAITACPWLGVPGSPPASVMEGPGHSPHLLRLDQVGLDFAMGIWDEVLEVFDSPWVHLGGDEVDPTQWRDSSEMCALAAERGLGGPDELLGWFIDRLREHLVDRGRVPLGWDEVTDSAHGAGMATTVWRHERTAPELARRGHEVVVCPYQRYYFDYYASTDECEPVTIGGCTPVEKVWAYDPYAAFDPAGRGRLLGLQACLWTEYLATARQLEYMLWPRASVVADRAWSGPLDEGWDEFQVRLAVQVERLAAAGVELRGPDGPRPWQAGGSGRRRRPGVGREFLDLDPRNDVDDNHSSGLPASQWRAGQPNGQEGRRGGSHGTPLTSSW